MSKRLKKYTNNFFVKYLLLIHELLETLIQNHVRYRKSNVQKVDHNMGIVCWSTILLENYVLKN